MICRSARLSMLLAVVALTSSLVGASAVAASSQLGALFEIGAGARPLGMGGAFVGVADDENAVFYNPAGLAFLQGRGITSLYSTQYEVIMYGALGYAQRSLAAGFLLMGSPRIDATGPGGEIRGQFDYTNRAALLGTGVELPSDWLPASSTWRAAVGGRLKYLQVTSAEEGSGPIAAVHGSGYALDVGLLVELSNVRAGLIYENLFGQPVRYTNGTSEPWPGRLSIGGAAMLGQVRIAADIRDLAGSFRTLHLGAELPLGRGALRAGLTSPLGRSSVGRPDITGGFGIQLGPSQVDYALLLPSELPMTHRLSLTLRF